MSYGKTFHACAAEPVTDGSLTEVRQVALPKRTKAMRHGPTLPQLKRGEALERAQDFCAVSPEMVGQLRDMFFLGDANVTGDPLRMLSNAIDAARAVMSAKTASRFKGSEVDLLVARELRSISEAADRATRNLTNALEIM